VELVEPALIDVEQSLNALLLSAGEIIGDIGADQLSVWQQPGRLGERLAATAAHIECSADRPSSHRDPT